MKIKSNFTAITVLISLILISCASAGGSVDNKKSGNELIWQSSSVSADIKKAEKPDTSDISLPDVQSPIYVTRLPEHFRLYFSNGFLLLPEPVVPDAVTGKAATPAAIAESGATELNTADTQNSQTIPPAADNSAENALPSVSLAAAEDPGNPKAASKPADNNSSRPAFLELFPESAYKSYLPEDVILSEETPEKIAVSNEQLLTHPLELAGSGKKSYGQSQSAPGTDKGKTVSEDPADISSLVLWNRNGDAEIRLDGRNWYFISSDKPQLISYEKRFLDGNEAVFWFLPKKEGLTRLLFRRHDLLTDKREEKYMDILIGPELSAKPAASETDVTENGISSDVSPDDTAAADDEGSAGQGSAESAKLPEMMDLSAYNGMSKSQILEIIAKFTSAGMIGNAILLADYAFTELFPDDFNDDLLWILGQLHELTGPERDLRKAIYYYSQLVELYPFSIHYKDAEGRAGYLERFHIYFK